MLGATAAEFQDLWSTPLGPARPGVWIQAIAYRTLAAEQRRAPRARRAGAAPAQLALAALLSALAAALATPPARAPQRGARRARRRAGSRSRSGCWSARGLLLDPVVPLGQLAAHYVLGLEGVRRRFQRRLDERERSLVDALQRRRGDRDSRFGRHARRRALPARRRGGRRAASRCCGLRPRASSTGAASTGEASGGAPIGDEEAAAACLRARDVRVFAARRARPRGAPASPSTRRSSRATFRSACWWSSARAASRSTRPSSARSPPSARRWRSRSRTCAWSRACARPSTPRSRRSRARSRRATATRSCTAGGSRSSRR